MSYPENKSEHYSNFGGINTKVSRYITGQQQAIRLVNYDFSRTGALTKRPDTTQYRGASFGPIRSMYEFTQLSGVSYNLSAGNSGLFASGPLTYGPSLAAPFNGLNMATGGTLFFGDFEPMVDQLWIANVPVDNGLGTFYRRFMKWSNIKGFPLPDVVYNAQMDLVSGFVNNFTATIGVSDSAAGVFFATNTGYRYSLAWVNNRDVEGPVYPVMWRKNIYDIGATSVFIFPPYGASPAIYSDFFNNDASALLVFRENIGVTAARANTPDVVSLSTAIFKIPAAAFAAGVSYLIDTGAANQTYLLGATTALYEMKTDIFPFSLSGGSFTAFNYLDDVNAQKRTGFPQLIAVYNDMMFASGSSLVPSTVFWSQKATPEWFENKSATSIRNNDGDVVTCMIPYDGQLVIGKRFSLHIVNGFTPDSLSFSEKTIQYGIMNNRSACVWEDQLWFLDGSGKGICQFNGSNVGVVTDPVEPIFQRMNVAAAKTEAFMIHAKARNEVWCGIPIDDSAVVNCIVFYDYSAKAWGTNEGLSPSAIMIAKSTLNRDALVMGFSNATSKYLNTTFTGAEAVTTIARFPFVTNFGWSTTQVYRRLYVDVDPVLGVTQSFNANLYLNQSDTAALGTTIPTTQYQTRIDFGLPGKGLSVELIEGSTLPLRLNGYTIESRFQRNV